MKKVIYIINNVFKTINVIDFSELLNLSLNSFFLASVSSLIIVAIAILFQYIKKISKSKTVFYLSEIVSLTYALPGAVIALSLIILLAFLILIIENNGLFTGSPHIDSINKYFNFYSVCKKYFFTFV